MRAALLALIVATPAALAAPPKAAPAPAPATKTEAHDPLWRDGFAEPQDALVLATIECPKDGGDCSVIVVRTAPSKMQGGQPMQWRESLHLAPTVAKALQEACVYDDGPRSSGIPQARTRCDAPKKVADAKDAKKP